MRGNRFSKSALILFLLLLLKYLRNRASRRRRAQRRLCLPAPPSPPPIHPIMTTYLDILLCDVKIQVRDDQLRRRFIRRLRSTAVIISHHLIDRHPDRSAAERFPSSARRFSNRILPRFLHRDDTDLLLRLLDFFLLRLNAGFFLRAAADTTT